MVEDDDEIAEQLRVGGHALVPRQQQLQCPALLGLELFGLLQLGDVQAPVGTMLRGWLGPQGPACWHWEAVSTASAHCPPFAAHLWRSSSLAVRVRGAAVTRSSPEPCAEALGSGPVSSLPLWAP